MNLTEGTTLKDGKYTIKKVLGKGSFGITYLASAKFKIKESLGEIEVTSDVAVKEFFMSDISSRGENSSFVEGSSSSIFTNYRQKFRKEAENLSKLEHPNIVHVYDVFDENKTSYYVMEYIKGQSLDEYVSEKGAIDESQALEIIKKIGTAVDYMHSNHVLHLDIKPKNIMMGDDGRLALIDFGLSKQFTETGEPESSTSIGMGTPGYAPLEQSQYKHTDKFPATLDVYALGATLYKMLTGKRPAEASEILNEGLNLEPLRTKGVSDKMVATIEKAMCPAKKDRYQTIKELLNAITDEPVSETIKSDPGEEKDKKQISKKDNEDVSEIKGDESDVKDKPDVREGKENKNGVEEKNESPKVNNDKGKNKSKLLKIIIPSVLLLVAIAVLLIYFLTGSKSIVNVGNVTDNIQNTETSSVDNINPTEKELTIEDRIYFGEDNDNFLKTASGLEYYILKEGSAKKPSASDNVEVHYRCLDSEGHELNNTFDGSPVNISLGSILEGFKEGVMLIGEGGRIILRIPPELGYGSQTSDITYDVELISIK